MDSNTPSRYVICMKWGTKYGPEYVNRLYAMVSRHLTLDFQMVCLTDNADGIHPNVRCLRTIGPLINAVGNVTRSVMKSLNAVSQPPCANWS